MIKTSKEISVIALFTAMLIGVQFALSGIRGVELVTVYLLCFSYAFGPWRGCISALAFALLRNFIFGFFPTVIILYCIYYPLFALICGFLGQLLEKKQASAVLCVVVMTVVAVVETICFTLLDDVITPMFFGYTSEATVAYFYAAIPTCVSQVICVAISVGVLFIPLSIVLKRIRKGIFPLKKCGQTGLHA